MPSAARYSPPSPRIGDTLAAATGASLKEPMARMGHSSTRAALTYQHAGQDRERAIAQALGSAFAMARETRIENVGGTRPPQGPGTTKAQVQGALP